MGLPAGGRLLGSVGNPLGDREDRGHSHTVAATTVTTSTVAAHGHGIDPPLVLASVVATVQAPVIGTFDQQRSTLNGPGHSHLLDGPLFSSGLADAHSHEVPIPALNSGDVGTGQVMPYVQLLACRNDSATAPALPVGATVFFTLPGCPAGWSEQAAARGRAVVGLRSGGTVAGTVGDALVNLENRIHSHTIGPVNVTTSADPDHVHSVDFPTMRTNQSNATSTNILGGSARYIIGVSTHDHTVEVPTINTFLGGGHTHQVTIPQTQTTTAGTGQVIPYIQLLACRNDSAAAAAPTIPAGAATFFSLPACPEGWSETAAARGRAVVGLRPGGTVGAPLGNLEDRAHAHGTVSVAVNTSVVPDHFHLLNPPAVQTSVVNHVSEGIEFFTDRNWTIEAAASHRHTVDIPEFSTELTGAHMHGVAVPAMPTTTASTGQVMPYVQMLVCSKG